MITAVKDYEHSTYFIIEIINVHSMQVNININIHKAYWNIEGDRKFVVTNLVVTRRNINNTDTISAIELVIKYEL